MGIQILADILDAEFGRSIKEITLFLAGIIALQSDQLPNCAQVKKSKLRMLEQKIKVSESKKALLLQSKISGT